MGISGLRKDLYGQNQIHRINIADEVNKCENPIVVIDFPNLTHYLDQRVQDIICGVRYPSMIQYCEKYFVALKNAGCSLVFIAPWYDADFDINQRLKYLNGNFEKNVNIYDQIEDGIVLQNIDVSNDLNLKASKFLLATIARKYGAFLDVTEEKCNLEIVEYATQHNAMAILSSNTEFLIFDGSWQIWSTYDLQVNELNQSITTTQYKPHCLVNFYALAKHQLPLFATLMGNKITGENFDDLNRFHRGLGPTKYRFQNVARYVRKVCSTHLSDLDIRRITQHVFGTADDKMQKLIRQSLNFYNLNYSEAIIDDPLERKLVNTNVYRTYKAGMSPVQIIFVRFYDTRNCFNGANYAEVLIDWDRRKSGILRQRFNDDSFKKLYLTKKSFNESYQVYAEPPVYPDFDLPPLERLYLQTEIEDDNEINEIKWKIFRWIMSFSAEEISTIKRLPKDFLMTSTILLALVKSGLIDVEQADGFLYTAKMVRENATNDVQYPTVLTAKHVRSAHIYQGIFPHMKKNFVIAGLKSVTQSIPQFDGVFFQNFMDRVSKLDADEREVLFEPIQECRIYYGKEIECFS